MSIRKFGMANIEAINNLQTKFNIKLPFDYKKFLLDYNGGIISKSENCEVSVKGINENIHVDVLFGIKTSYENAELDTWMNLFKNEILEGALIIGDSIEHGFLVLINNDQDSCICYWDHAYEFPGSSDESNVLQTHFQNL